jgi:hypothetical protein
LKVFPAIFVVSDHFQAAFQASLQEEPPFIDVEKLHGLCAGSPQSQQGAGSPLVVRGIKPPEPVETSSYATHAGLRSAAPIPAQSLINPAGVSSMR